MATTVSLGGTDYELRTSASGTYQLYFGGKYLELTKDSSLAPSRPRLSCEIGGTTYYVRENFGTRVKAIEVYTMFNIGQGWYCFAHGQVAAYDTAGNNIITGATRKTIISTKGDTFKWGSIQKVTDGNWRSTVGVGKGDTTSNDIHGHLTSRFDFASPVDLGGLMVQWGYDDPKPSHFDECRRQIKYMDENGTWHNLYYSTSKSMGATWGTYVGRGSKFSDNGSYNSTPVGGTMSMTLFERDDNSGGWEPPATAYTYFPEIYQLYYNLSTS